MNSLHEGEDLRRGVRFPRLSVNAEESRVGLHDRFERAESRTYAKHSQTLMKTERGEGRDHTGFKADNRILFPV